MAEALDDDCLRRAILRLARERGDDRTFCPSEVARRLADDWRPLMPRIRAVAGALADEGRLEATQRGRPVDARAARGPIRLRLGPRDAD